MRATLSDADQSVRSRGIGSSEIAAIVGQNPWAGKHHIWLRKTGRLDNFEPTERMLAGQFLEPAIIAMYEHKMGCKVTKPPTVVCEAHRYVVDSIDGIVDGEKIGIEAKSTHWRNSNAWGKEWTDDIPAYYLVQCQWHMGVHELGECHVPVWNGESFRVYKIVYDEDLFLALVASAQDFWETHVIPDVAPELDGKQCTTDWVNRQSRRKKEAIEADEEMAIYLSERDRIDAEVKKLAEARNAIDNKIRNAIGENGGIESGKFKATWSETQGREKIDVNELIKLTGATQEDVDKCTKRGSSYRRLTFQRKPSES